MARKQHIIGEHYDAFCVSDGEPTQDEGKCD